MSYMGHGNFKDENDIPQSSESSWQVKNRQKNVWDWRMQILISEVAKIYEAPWPALQLLRTADLNRAREEWMQRNGAQGPGALSLLLRNKAGLRQVGRQKLQQRLADCRNQWSEKEKKRATFASQLQVTNNHKSQYLAGAFSRDLRSC